MSREERDNAIRCLKIWIEREPYIQTYKTCLEVLEQEPYDDAKYHEEHGEIIVDKAVWEDAKRALEQEPTGHWIVDRSLLPFTYTCDICSRNVFDDYDYCPYCGCRMVEPTCDTCEYNTAAFNPCNACKDKSEYKPQERSE